MCPLKSSIMRVGLKDWIRGTGESCCERKEVVRVVTGLHRFCWKCLQQIDEGLQKILDALHARRKLKDAIIYLYTDHRISLYEHGELCEAPWEACLRSFMLRKTRMTTDAARSSVPLSLACLPTMLIEDAGIFADWHHRPTSRSCCVTLGLAYSWLVRARIEPPVDIMSLRTFFGNYEEYDIRMFLKDDLYNTCILYTHHHSSNLFRDLLLHIEKPDCHRYVVIHLLNEKGPCSLNATCGRVDAPPGHVV